MQDIFTSSPPRSDWKKVVYKDELCQKTEKCGTRIGAAVYDATEDMTVLIHTGGTGVNSTNTRAELLSILVALRGEGKSDTSPKDMIILTDSLSSLHIIRKVVHSPMQIAG